jgi:hypothetical protein
VSWTACTWRLPISVPGQVNHAYFTDVTNGCARPRSKASECVKKAAEGYDVLTGLGTNPLGLSRMTSLCGNSHRTGLTGHSHFGAAVTLGRPVAGSVVIEVSLSKRGFEQLDRVS